VGLDTIFPALITLPEDGRMGGAEEKARAIGRAGAAVS